jgi:hypothetical protein
MKKRISLFACLILAGLFSISIASALGTQLICLNDNDKIYFSDCNPAMEDYICTSAKCQICVNEIRTGVYCSANPNDCNVGGGECTYLYDEPEAPVIDPLEPDLNIVLISPEDLYSLAESEEIAFSFKVTKYRLDKCELIVDGDVVATKGRTISWNTPYKLYYTPESGEHTWRIDCTEIATDGGDLFISETRTLNIGGSTTSPITLTSPANSYSATGQQNITFTFSISGSLAGITQCNLNLNNQLTSTGIKADNTITKSVPVGAYTWKIECIKGTGSISSESRSLTINAVAPPADAGGSPSGGGGSGGGGGTATYTLTAEQLANGSTKDLIKGAKFSFKIANQTHFATLNEIKGSSAKITVSSTPQTFTLNIGDEKKVDVNNDNSYDLSVKLINITGNKAKIAVKGISEIILGSGEESKETQTAESTSEEQGNIAGITGNVVGFAKNNKLPVALGFVIIVAIAGLISYNVRRKGSDEKNNKGK